MESPTAGGVRAGFNKHKWNVSDLISQWEVDYISFLPSLWLGDTGDNTACGITSVTKDVLSKFQLEWSVCGVGCTLLRCRGTCSSYNFLILKCSLGKWLSINSWLCVTAQMSSPWNTWGHHSVSWPLTIHPKCEAHNWILWMKSESPLKSWVFIG